MVKGKEIRPEPFEELLQRTELARGLRAERPIDARVIDQSEVPAMLTEAVRSEWTPEELDAYTSGLVSVGLWPADRDLLDEYTRVMTAEMAGFYLPTERAIFVVRDASMGASESILSFVAQRDFAREWVIAHELVHLLQHTAYPHLNEPKILRANGDAEAAVQAAVEGDALLYGFRALVGPDPTPDAFSAAFGDSGSDALAESPALIRLTLTFPYVSGYALSYREGRALLDDPPVSTEQVIHSEARHEPFRAIDLGPVADVLPGGCEPVAENSVGELGLSVLFRDLGLDVDENAWIGWNGDRYLAVRCDGRLESAWVLAWDSQTDAHEFALAYDEIADAVAARAGFAGAPIATRLGDEVHIVSPGLLDVGTALEARPRREPVATLDELLAFLSPGDASGAPDAQIAVDP